MTGCRHCGALSGLDPEGRCNYCGDAVDDFLVSRAPGVEPTQPAAPEPSAWETTQSRQWRAKLESAEAQLAAMVPASMHEELRLVMLSERRAKESAEAQLAAVREAIETHRALMGASFGDDIAMAAAAGFQAVLALLSTPSPSAAKETT